MSWEEGRGGEEREGEEREGDEREGEGRGGSTVELKLCLCSIEHTVRDVHSVH